MTSLTSLWLPILLSAVAVFIVSSIVHMALPHHRNDFARLPGEDDVMRALAQGGPAPATYIFPFASSMTAMKDPTWIEKRTRGPSGNRTLQTRQWINEFYARRGRPADADAYFAKASPTQR